MCRGLLVSAGPAPHLAPGLILRPFLYRLLHLPPWCPLAGGTGPRARGTFSHLWTALGPHARELWGHWPHAWPPIWGSGHRLLPGLVLCGAGGGVPRVRGRGCGLGRKERHQERASPRPDASMEGSQQPWVWGSASCGLGACPSVHGGKGEVRFASLRFLGAGFENLWSKTTKKKTCSPSPSSHDATFTAGLPAPSPPVGNSYSFLKTPLRRRPRQEASPAPRGPGTYTSPPATPTTSCRTRGSAPTEAGGWGQDTSTTAPRAGLGPASPPCPTWWAPPGGHPQPWQRQPEAGPRPLALSWAGSSWLPLEVGSAAGAGMGVSNRGVGRAADLRRQGNQGVPGAQWVPKVPRDERGDCQPRGRTHVQRDVGAGG